MIGCHLKLHVYAIKKYGNSSLLTGFSTDYKKEYTIIIDSSTNIRLGQSIEFDVYKEERRGLIPTKGTIREVDEKDVVVAYDVVNIRTTVFFDPDNEFEAWSPQFGWIYVPSDFVRAVSITTETPYRVRIKRDYSKLVQEHFLLFSITLDNYVTHDADKKSAYIDDYREAKEKRMLVRKNVKWSEKKRNLPKAGTSNNWADDDSPEEARIKALKKEADSVSLFLVLDTKVSNKLKGSAWAMKLGKIGLQTDVINASSMALEPGSWYEGVVKWDKRLSKNPAYAPGHVAEKAWRKTEIPPFVTRKTDKSLIELELDVNFVEYSKYVQVSKDKKILPSSKVQWIEVPTTIYEQNKNVHAKCLLVNRHDRPASSDDRAFWVVREVGDILGVAEEESPGWSTSGHAPAQVPPNNDIYEDDGIVPNDEEGVPYEDEFSIPRIQPAPPPKIADQPHSGTNTNRPKPTYSGAQNQNTNGNFSFRGNTFGSQTSSSITNERKFYGNYEIYDKTTTIHYALVVETSRERSFIFVPEYGTVMVLGKLKIGDWVKTELSALVTPLPGGNIKFLAVDTRPAQSNDQLPELRHVGDKIQLKLNLDIRNRRPIQGGNFLIKSDVVQDEVFCPYTILVEGTTDTTNLSDLQNSGKLDFWSEHRFKTEDRTSYFQWDLVSVCMSTEMSSRSQRENYSNNQNSRNATPLVPNSQSSSSRAAESDRLLNAMWRFNEIRTALKYTNYPLYCELENHFLGRQSTQHTDENDARRNSSTNYPQSNTENSADRTSYSASTSNQNGQQRSFANNSYGQNNSPNGSQPSTNRRF